MIDSELLLAWILISKITNTERIVKGLQMKYCSACDGSGEGMTDGSHCSTCHGSGVDDRLEREELDEIRADEERDRLRDEE